MCPFGSSEPPPGRDALEGRVRRSLLSDRSLPSVLPLAVFLSRRLSRRALRPAGCEVLVAQGCPLPCDPPQVPHPLLSRASLTPPRTASGPSAAFWIHSLTPQGRDAVARRVRRFGFLHFEV
jgi:hypothetical protein